MQFFLCLDWLLVQKCGIFHSLLLYSLFPASQMFSKSRHVQNSPNSGSFWANIEFEQKLASLPYVSEVGKVYGTPGQCAFTRTHPLDDTYKDYVYTGIIACDTTAFRLFDFKIIHDFGITGDKSIWLTERAVRELNIDEQLFSQVHLLVHLLLIITLKI